MKNLIPSTFTVIASILLILGIFSCKKENLDLSNLNETIIVRHKNADMPVYIHGNGSEKVFLIMLHGGPGGTGLNYRVNTYITEIEKNNAVVYFDQRGSGASQGNYSKEDVSIDLMAEDVLAIVQTIKAKYGKDSKFCLVGHSWGGTLGSAVLLKKQESFFGWIEVNGGHNMQSFKLYRTLLPKTAREQIALGNSVNYWQNVITDVQNVGSEYTTENHLTLNRIANTVDPVLAEDQIINEIKAEISEGVRVPISNRFLNLWNSRKIGNILDFREGLNRVNFTDRLSEITIPSLVLWGKNDHVIPLVLGQEAYDNLGSVEKELFIFERSGHSPMFTEADLFADKVIGFINKHK